MEGRNERRCFPKTSTRAEKLCHSHRIVGAVEASKPSVAGSVSRGYNTLGREATTFSVSLKMEPGAWRMTIVRLWKELKALGGGSRRLPCGSTGFCWFVEIGATSGPVDTWLLSGP